LLEVGCGAGALLVDLSNMGHRCDALETSSDARDLARVLNAGDDHVAVHAEAQDGWASAFDIVLALEVLEHIEDDAAALSDWARWLRLGGWLVLSVPAHPALWNASDVWAGHFRRYREDELRRVVASAGFQVEHVECYGFPLSNLIDPIRARMHAKRLEEEKANRPQDGENGGAHGSARSGTERTMETRFYPLQASGIGSLSMRMFLFLQSCFLQTRLGTGFILVAERR
jgi:SAM-dependent methyltransferase